MNLSDGHTAPRPELLAPAGSPDALRAAVQNGADAVYLGYGTFHARVRASGFSEDDFRDAVRYCHMYGVRVYLTLNTLLTDRELPSALEQAQTASRMGVDAALVQDWGLFMLIRAALPDLPVHASTQMSVFTSGGVQILRDAGCTRVVVARECSRDDIAALCRNGVEIETFVHGALCMCYSGQCAMSAVIGGRSGNRGRCAQPCRLPCAAGKFRPDAYDLSLKDLNLSFHLSELQDMGVASLKIEGRLKRPEYAALVTSVYARLLRERRKPTADETSMLQRVFSRSGFTDAYWRGSPDAKMFGTRADGLQDAETLFRQARETYERDGTRKVSVRAVCTIQPGTAARLTLSDADGHCVSVEGGVPETARNRPLTPQSVRERLIKTGGTAYVLDDVRMDIGDGLSLSASALNALRRDALDALTISRTAVPERRVCVPPFLPDADCTTESPRYCVSAYRPEQLVPELLELRPARVYVPLDWFDGAYTFPRYLSDADGVELCAVLPRVWRDRDEPALLDALRRAVRQRVGGVLVGNIGHLPLLAGMGLRVYGDFGLNVTNAYSAAWLAQQGLQSVCVSFELRMEQIRDMRKPLPVEALTYGRLPLMITETRPGGRPAAVLVDRTGTEFPLLNAFGGRTEIQNSRPVWLADRDAWRHAGLSFARLRFTVESPAECADVVRAYLERRPASGAFTRGLYERGVE